MVIPKIAGFLLIIPGFVTDLLGIIMLVKPLRGYVWNNLFLKKVFIKIMEQEKIKMIILLRQITEI